MNRRIVLNILGRMLRLESALLLLPLAVSALYREKSIFAFLITAAISFVFGTVMKIISKPRENTIYAREGFLIVSLVWIFVSLIGALPFTIGKEIPNYIDAVFETVSGFTTTGSSILKNVEALSHGMLFWRSFTHWIGGMGILVFVMAILPNISDRTIHIMRAEMPGPSVDKIVPRVKDTAKILYIIYIVITLVEVALLKIGGMPLFESVVHAFGTAGTGGFGVKADSIASYSPFIQWVIAVFMMIFGINFNVYFLIVVKRVKEAFKSTELWVYISIMLGSTAVVAANIYNIYGNLSDTFRNSYFQVSSIMTTTGYATQNFDKWPLLSKAILFLLMIIGACGGSTAGGLKVSRVVLLFKQIGREINKMLHPRSVSAVRMEGKPVDEKTLQSVDIYLAVYMLCVGAVFLILCLEPTDFETNMSATMACFNNIGPGLGMVGPASNFSFYSPLSKIVLSFAMLLGRLEIFPLILLFTPKTWKRQ